VNLVRDSFAELSHDTYVVDPSTAEAIPA
jgi:hypothetical protein